MENQHTVNGLLRKRQELNDQVAHLQAEIARLVPQIDAVETTIRLFHPGELPTGRLRPAKGRHKSPRGECMRLVAGILRDAQGPMTARQIQVLVMEARGMDQRDRSMWASMRERVGACLRRMRDRGRVVSDEREGESMGWRVAE